MTDMPTIYVYRPTELSQDCAGVAYDEDGRQIAGHISSSIYYFRLDMGLNGAVGIGARKHEKYKERYPNGYRLEEVVGNWWEHPVMGKWT